MAERLGEMLIRRKAITAEQLALALQEQLHTGNFLGEILVRMNFIKEEELLQILAEQFNTRFITLSSVKISPEVISLVPKALVLEYKIMPIGVRGDVLLIAMSNPLDIWPTSVLQQRLSLLEVQFVLATKADIKKHVQKYYGSEF